MIYERCTLRAQVAAEGRRRPAICMLYVVCTFLALATGILRAAYKRRVLCMHRWMQKTIAAARWRHEWGPPPYGQYSHSDKVGVLQVANGGSEAMWIRHMERIWSLIRLYL